MFYDDSWGGIFRNARAVVFVADSQRLRNDANAQFFHELDVNLVRAGLPLTIPYVLQANKRDLPDIVSIDELSQSYGRGTSALESNAFTGEGVLETFRLLLERMRDQDATVPVIDWSRVVVVKRPPRAALAANVESPRAPKASLATRVRKYLFGV